MRFSVLILALMLMAGEAGAADFFTLKGHGGPIKGIDVSPDGKAVVTASFDNSLGLWRNGRPTWLEAHRAAVNVVRFVDDRTVISAGDDFDLYLWDLTIGTARRLAGHKGKILSLAVSPDKTRIASASWDGSIGLWSVGDPEHPRFLRGHSAGVNDVVFSADGTLLYSASADGTVRVWDVAAGTIKRQLLRNGFGINTLVLNAEAGWLAYGAVDGVTRIVDVDSAETIADFTLNRRPILAMAADRQFRRLAIGDGEGYIAIYDTATWRVTADFRATTRGPVWALRFSGDGENIHAGGLDEAMYSWPVARAGAARKIAAHDKPYLKGAKTESNGERQFNRKCSICHALGADGERRAGPTLYGLFGRPAGTVPRYNYSPTLRSSDIVWTDKTIDALFEQGPDVYIRGSKMPMQRITKQQDRADLIEFLRKSTRTGNN